MSTAIKVPVDPEAESDLVSVLGSFADLVQNERVRAYNEGVDAAYEYAALRVEGRLLLSDFPRDEETVRDAASAIRALKSE